MGFLDTVKGWFAPQQTAQQGGASAPLPYGERIPPPPSAGDGMPERDADTVAIERYRYLLRTAPPETIEKAHAEAFERLTPDQRQQVLTDLSAGVPEAERARSAEPRELARMATRAELNQPGTMERTLGRGGMGGGGMGLGGVFAGSMLGTVAGVVVGSAIANAFFADPGAGDTSAGGDTGGDAGGDSSGDSGGDSGGDTGGDAGGDAGGGDYGGGDYGGGDFGGGDYGGGDFGGGGFGGGDFGGGDFGGGF